MNLLCKNRSHRFLKEEPVKNLTDSWEKFLTCVSTSHFIYLSFNLKSTILLWFITLNSGFFNQPCPTPSSTSKSWTYLSTIAWNLTNYWQLVTLLYRFRHEIYWNYLRTIYAGWSRLGSGWTIPVLCLTTVNLTFFSYVHRL